MLLGLSSLTIGAEVDLRRIADGSEGDGGISHGEVLVAFVDAAHAGDPAAMDVARAAMARACGRDGLVDAAAVYANFQMMNRIADGTGTPLDEFAVEPSAEVRATLGLDDLASRRIS